jgi:hypothetical protein
MMTSEQYIWLSGPLLELVLELRAVLTSERMSLVLL